MAEYVEITMRVKSTQDEALDPSIVVEALLDELTRHWVEDISHIAGRKVDGPTPAAPGVRTSDTEAGS